MAREFVLPSSVVTVGDIARLRLELERLSDFLTQARLRQPGTAVTVPRVTKRLDEVAHLAGLTLTKDSDCQALLKELNDLQTAAPRIHISFATDPSEDFLSQIIKWFRNNIHPQIILTIGLQPALTAGFVMRTSSHYYDCSLRRHFDDKKSLLAEALNIKPKVKAPQ